MGKPEGVRAVFYNERRAFAHAWSRGDGFFYPLVFSAIVVAPVLPSGWPYWTDHPWSAVFAIAMAASLGGAGGILMLGTGSRRTGACLVGSGFLFALNWLSAWNFGVLPVVGECVQSAFFLVLGVGILLHGRATFSSWLEWAWTAEAVLVLVVQQLGVILVSRPEQLGYATDVLWPTVWPLSQSALDIWLQTASYLYATLALTFAFVLWRQRRGTPRAEARRRFPVMIVGSLFAVLSAVIQYPIMTPGVSLDGVLAARTAQSACAILVPLTLLASAMRSRWEQHTVTTRLIRTIGVNTTLASIESSLESVLAQPVELLLWLPDSRCYIDTNGQVHRNIEAEATRTDDSQRLHTSDGRPLALCRSATENADRSDLVAAALEACGPALRAAQLHIEILEHVRASQERLLVAEQEGRRELARNLHDGVQQDLAALSIDINRLARAASDDRLRDQARDCNERTLEIIERLRQITRGLHPPALAEGGLTRALEEDAERLGTAVTLDLDADRLPPRLEIALYYVLKESLTNAHKHAHASTIHVGLRDTPSTVVAEVNDNGVGGASLTFGGGLHGADDRVRALRGRLDVQSEPGFGTHVTVTLPKLEPAS